jgi:hypothetical protein
MVLRKDSEISFEGQIEITSSVSALSELHLVYADLEIGKIIGFSARR